MDKEAHNIPPPTDHINFILRADPDEIAVRAEFLLERADFNRIYRSALDRPSLVDNLRAAAGIILEHTKYWIL